MKDAHYSGLTAKFSLGKTDNLPGTLTVTMMISRWREVYESLSSEAYAQWPLKAAIRDLIAQVNQVLDYHEKEPE